MSQSNIPPERGGAIYRVTCLRANVDARTATEADFFEVCIRAPNSLSARLRARNENPDCGTAFEAVKIAEGQL